MDLRVDPSSPVPPSRQLVEALLDRMAGGLLHPGDRLPSVRSLAVEALVNPNTAHKAYRDLEALGTVEGRSGAGVFVTAAAPALARAARRGATLARLEEALATALGAGHAADDLERLLASWLASPLAAARGARARAEA